MGPFTIALIAAVVLGGVWTYRAFFSERGRTRRALGKASTVRVAQANDGQVVKLVGQLKYTEGPLVAPLTGRACALLHVTVEQYVSHGRNGHWRTIVNQRESSREFALVDETGEALVDISKVELALHMDRHFRSGFLEGANINLETFLQRHGHSSKGWLFNKTIRYKEGVLEEGETVTVLGRCVAEHNPDPTAAGATYRSAPLRKRIVAPPGGAVLVSDE